jgi:hypothetical protein
MSKTIEATNKTLVLEAFDTLFNKRDYKAAERWWRTGAALNAFDRSTSYGGGARGYPDYPFRQAEAA